MSDLFLSFYRRLPWFKGKLPLGKKLFKKCIENSATVSIKAHNGIIYHLPNTIENIGIELLINGIYERRSVQFLKNHIQDNAIYFDVGANIGSLCLPVLKNKKNIQYYGFEASPMVFPFLQKNLESNRIENFTLINSLVHKDTDQSMKFFQSKWYGKSSLAPTYSHEFVLVNSIRLDQYCLEKGINKIDWLKVDVEGFELFVFEGIANMLQSKKIKNILFEFETWSDETAGFKAGTALRYLKLMGYELFDLKGRPWIKRKGEKMIWAKPIVS